MDLNNKVYFTWSNGIIALTIIIGLVFLSAYILSIRGYLNHIDTDLITPKLFIIIGCTAIIIFVLYSTPTSLSWDKNGITINKCLGSTRIHTSEIVCVEDIPKSDIQNSIRQLGSGGLGGFTGYFYTKKHGRVIMYVTKKDNLILVTTKSKKYIFNCDKKNEFINFWKR